MAKTNYGVPLLPSELRKLGITKFNIRHAENRNTRKMIARTGRLDDQVLNNTMPNLTYSVGHSDSGRRKATVYLLVTNKRDAAKMARERGFGSEGYEIMPTGVAKSGE